MSNIEESITVDVPVQAAYEQWSRFEAFPEFMEGVESITRLGEDRLQWKAKLGGKSEQWVAKITEQTEGERIAWAAEEGAANAGVVTFHHLDADKCRVMLQLEYDPDGVVEKAGDAVGVVTHRVKGDLKNFKQMMESRPTG